MKKYIPDSSDYDKRLDIYLVEQIPVLSRSSIRKLLDSSKVLVNSNAEKASYKLKVNDIVSVAFDPMELKEIPDIDMPVIYEDGDCIVINKPTGVLTHSKGSFNPEATVATFIRNRIKGMDGERAGIVHRLDRATSGVIIAAKTPEALSWLQKQFSARKVKKHYLAVVEGNLEPAEAIIDMPIARNPKIPKTFHVNASGKPAKTTYRTIKSNKNMSLVELMPETGRTHQLRVHLAQLGHPIVGDTLYGGKPYERLLLHAHTLELTLPSKKRQVFTAPIPPIITKVL